MTSTFNLTRSDLVFPKKDPGTPVFSEGLAQRTRRWALGLAYSAQPKRINLLPRIVLDTICDVLEPIYRVNTLLKDATPLGQYGYLGVCDDVSANSILEAYEKGAFPVAHVGQMKWWSPETRAVLRFSDTRIEKSLRKTLKRDNYDVTFDTDFAAVLERCARPRKNHAPLTWLTPRVMYAFWDLHRAGYAHSIEIWSLEPQLIGGIFGVALGDIFFGESQFHLERDASKIASVYLNRHLAEWGFKMREAKVITPYLETLGFKSINRSDFQSLLLENSHVSRQPKIWEADLSLDVPNWNPSAR